MIKQGLLERCNLEKKRKFQLRLSQPSPLHLHPLLSTVAGGYCVFILRMRKLRVQSGNDLAQLTEK